MIHFHSLGRMLAGGLLTAFMAVPAWADDAVCPLSSKACSSKTECSQQTEACPAKDASSEPVFYIIHSEACKGDFAERVPSKGGETVLEALALIGGFEMHAGKKIWVSRLAQCDGEYKEQILPVNCEALAQGGRVTNHTLQAGDRLFVVPQSSETAGCSRSSDCTVSETSPYYNACARFKGIALTEACSASACEKSAACEKGACEKGACDKAVCAKTARDKTACDKTTVAKAGCDKAACDTKNCEKKACEKTVSGKQCPAAGEKLAETCSRECPGKQAVAAASVCSSEMSACCCDGATETCVEDCKCANAITTAKVCEQACSKGQCTKEKCCEGKKAKAVAESTTHPVLDIADKLATSGEGIFCPGLSIDIDVEITQRRAQLLDVLRELESLDAESIYACAEQVVDGLPTANPFQANALRQTSSALEHAAAHLEEVELFGQADTVRRLAEQLRHESRQAAAGLRAHYFMSAAPAPERE